MSKKRRKQQTTLPLPMVVLGVVLIVAAAMVFLFQNRADGGTPALAVEPQKIEYGDVKLDTELTFEIKVTNQGNGVLRFKDQPYIEVLEGC